MTAEPLIELESKFSREQCRELLKAVEVTKVVLMGMGGDDMPLDGRIEERLSRLSFWQQTLENKLA